MKRSGSSSSLKINNKNLTISNFVKYIVFTFAFLLVGLLNSHKVEAAIVSGYTETADKITWTAEATSVGVDWVEIRACKIDFDGTDSLIDTYCLPYVELFNNDVWNPLQSAYGKPKTVKFEFAKEGTTTITSAKPDSSDYLNTSFKLVDYIKRSSSEIGIDFTTNGFLWRIKIENGKSENDYIYFQSYYYSGPKGTVTISYQNESAYTHDISYSYTDKKCYRGGADQYYNGTQVACNTHTATYYAVIGESESYSSITKTSSGYTLITSASKSYTMTKVSNKSSFSITAGVTGSRNIFFLFDNEVGTWIGKTETTYFSASNPVKIGSTSYNTMSQAITAAGNADIITVQTQLFGCHIIDKGSNTFTIDLNGNVLTCNSTAFTVKSGTVSFIKGIIKAVNYGVNVNLNDDDYQVNIGAGGVEGPTIYGGVYAIRRGANSLGLLNFNSGTLYAASNEDISDDVSDGTITTTGFFEKVKGSYSYGGTPYNWKGVHKPNAIASVSDGTSYWGHDTLQAAANAMTSTSYTTTLLKNVTECITTTSKTGTINLNSKTLTCDGTAIAVSGGSITITGGTIVSTSTTSGTPAVLTSSGTLTISNGTISGLIGVKANGGTVRVGTSGSTTGPTIYGKTYALQKTSGTLYFYSGTLYGIGVVSSGTISGARVIETSSISQSYNGTTYTLKGRDPHG